MNSRKDIILILLGALLLAAGVAPFLKPGLIAPVVPDVDAKSTLIKQLKDAVPQGQQYAASPRASLEDNVKDWLSPEENDDNWDYDLFTTIDVVWDAALREYVPRSRKAEEMPPFGVALVSVGYPTYTFMLSHSTLGPGKKEEDRLFSLKNVKTKQYIDDCKLNKPIPEAPYLTLKSFKVIKGKDADGIPFVRNVLTIDDRQFGQVVEVDDEKPLEFKGRVDILINSPTDPAWTLTLNAVGDKFSYFSRGWIKKLEFKKLFDKNEQIKLQKMLFKNQ